MRWRRCAWHRDPEYRTYVVRSTLHVNFGNHGVGSLVAASAADGTCHGGLLGKPLADELNNSVWRGCAGHEQLDHQSQDEEMFAHAVKSQRAQGHAYWLHLRLCTDATGIAGTACGTYCNPCCQILCGDGTS